MWEHQALLRARVITGTERLRAQFEQVRHDILCQPRDRAELRKQVIAMRQKMWESMASKDSSIFNLKKDHGGVTDIEFIVQFLILAHAHEHPELVRWSDNIRQLESLQGAGILPADTAGMLADAYRTLRDRIHALALQEQEAVVAAGQLVREREAVRAAWVAYLG